MSKSNVIMQIVGFFVSILTVILVVVVLYTLGHTAFDFGYRVFTEPAMTSESSSIDKVVQITGDMSSLEIGELLESKGLIQNKYLFLAQLKSSSYANSIIPGIYTLSTSMTARDMMQVMSIDEDEVTEEDTEI
ncbi:MAG: aminodeoxychorismate lyase [Lachnospiraceae bacterium]